MAAQTERVQIVTGVDKLLDLIIQKESISMGETISILKVKKEVVEQWSDVLHEQGLIKIRFTFNDRYLMTPEHYKATKGRSSRFGDLLTMNIVNLKKEEIDKVLLEREKYVKEKMKYVSENLENIKKLNIEVTRAKSDLALKEGYVKSQFSQIDKIKKLLESKQKEVEIREQKLDTKEKGLSLSAESTGKLKKLLFIERKKLDKARKFLIREIKSAMAAKDKNKKKSFILEGLKADYACLRKEAKVNAEKIRKYLIIIETKARELVKKESELKKKEAEIKAREENLSLDFGKLVEKERAIDSRAINLIEQEALLEEKKETIKEREKMFHFLSQATQSDADHN